MRMDVLINGNLGYVGPPLVRHLAGSDNAAFRLTGFDTGYFAHLLTTDTGTPERRLAVQHYGDLRSQDPAVYDGIDAVVHLAAISNDPIGNEFEAVTGAINVDASLAAARAAKAAGVKRFVFASSCSVYGAGSDAPRTEDDPINPLTAYAKSKIAMEQALSELAGPDFRVVCLRFATACGMSERLRLDLVLNDFVATALTKKRIEILSDGSPWRPLIHVDDMARAIEWGLLTDAVDDVLILNTGADHWNYQIRDLANAVAEVIGGIEVDINTDAMPDKRSYKVSFDRFTGLAAGFTPQVSIEQAVTGLVEGLTAIGFADPAFRESNLMRLNMLRRHISNGQLDNDLRWQPAA